MQLGLAFLDDEQVDSDRYDLFLTCLKRRIKRVREEKGLTQAEAANRVDMRPEDFQRFESLGSRKRFNPTIETMLKVAEALDVPVEALVREPDDGERALAHKIN